MFVKIQDKLAIERIVSLPSNLYVCTHPLSYAIKLYAIVRLISSVQTSNRVSAAKIGLFFSAELAPFIFPLFLSALDKKGRKINGARSSAKKTDQISQYFARCRPRCCKTLMRRDNRTVSDLGKQRNV